MKQAVSVLLLSFLLSVSAYSQETKTYNWDFWWKTAQSRQAHALKLDRDFQALCDKIPTLSPSEERWLKTEYDDTIAENDGRYTRRAMDAMQSREWSIRVAKPHAQEIESELRALSMQLNRAQETRHWTRVAALLMDYDFWQSIDDLQQRGVIDKKTTQFLGGIHGPTATLWAQQILNEVVLPYFDLKQ